ncbi:hypothetical protein C10C_0332 [Chlamydia serpentis]|uniref:Uncharacterized protein n=1 Tax=Chlamydia serpentis TaxID=1967782 RepID=A0A2R8FAT4_9CHLA|nr:hypothetical protein [Chlamydia serpentis]SPN73504.1 hypothetical protein C10C_0332 [Chlamydia serpentis]
MSINTSIPLPKGQPLTQVTKKSTQYFHNIQSRILFITIVFALVVTISTLLIGILLNIPIMYFLTGLAFVVVILTSFILYKKTTDLLKQIIPKEQENIELQLFSSPQILSSILNISSSSKEPWLKKINKLTDLSPPCSLPINPPYQGWKVKHSLFSLLCIQGSNSDGLLVTSLGRTLLIEEMPNTVSNSRLTSDGEESASPKIQIDAAIQQTKLQIKKESYRKQTFASPHLKPDLCYQVFLPEMLPETVHEYYYALYVSYIKTSIKNNVQLIQVPLGNLGKPARSSNQLSLEGKCAQSLAMISAVKYMAELYPDYPLTIVCIEQS